MVRTIAYAVLILFVTRLMVTCNEANAVELTLDGQQFTIPDGYHLELVAAPPLIDRPVSADFDERGRLYVTEASGTNANVSEQLETKPHRVLRLVDTDDDGQFDHSTVFADNMMLPEGALWHGGSLYVAAPPNIWKLTDTDDDGVADERIEWFQGKTLTGCANDLHGPYLGRDGWIYWCKGAFAEQTYEKAGRHGSPLVTRAAHIFRRHPTNSSLIEPVMNGGMDNPVEVTFNLAGERFFTTTFLQHPGGEQRDGIIHAIYGGLYGKDHDVIDTHIRTGDLMPTMTHLGAAAPSGLAMLESEELGFPGQLVASLFNMRKVTRHQLQESGATYTTTDNDLVVSDSLDFHPTDVLEDADGSLLIVDTGGWYKLCCPTSQLEKADVLGGIYRLRRDGRHNIDDSRGQQIDWSGSTPAQLVTHLGDDRPAVRKRSQQSLVELGEAAVTPLRLALQSDSAEFAVRAVWTMAQIDGDAASDGLAAALIHPASIVRQAALHAISVRRDPRHVNSVLRLLSDDTSSHVRRAAAEALGRIGGTGVSKSLLEMAGQTDDRILYHSLTYALCELDDHAALRKGLESDDLQTRVTAALASEQSANGSLVTVDDLGQLLPSSRNSAQIKRLLWITDRHPDWRRELVDAFAAKHTAASFSGLDQFLTDFRETEFAQSLAAKILKTAAPGSAFRLSALRALSDSNAAIPDDLVERYVQVLKESSASPADSVIAEADLVLQTLRKRRVSEAMAKSTAETLVAFAQSSDKRLAGWRTFASMPPGAIDVEDATLAEFIERLTGADSADRETALEAIRRVRLTPQQCTAIASISGRIGPLELPTILEVLAQHPTNEVGNQLRQSLQQSIAIGSIVDTDLAKWIIRFSESTQADILSIAQQRRVGLQDHIKRIARVVPLVDHADVRQGQALFHSAKAACVSCHELGYLGGDIGPDLSRIGTTRSTRDLLESIMVPSASIVRSYEPWQVETVDGRTMSGILRENSPQRVVLATSERKIVELSRDDIAEMKPSEVSIMPAGLGEQVTDQELADLVKFLMTAR